jgi:hypothetical protein
VIAVRKRPQGAYALSDAGGLGELDPFRGLAIPSDLAEVQVAGIIDVKFAGQPGACRGRALAVRGLKAHAA